MLLIMVLLTLVASYGVEQVSNFSLSLATFALGMILTIIASLLQEIRNDLEYLRKKQKDEEG